ncbi:hypothetical protein PQI66_09745 [Corynebacterium sp. USCH3]|uniref:hypothetical protein n=1 Tax=Corynebacterium sp. USCH3 TaxID=3024840 RepID=UPI00309DBD8E
MSNSPYKKTADPDRSTIIIVPHPDRNYSQASSYQADKYSVANIREQLVKQLEKVCPSGRNRIITSSNPQLEYKDHESEQKRSENCHPTKESPNVSRPVSGERRENSNENREAELKCEIPEASLSRCGVPERIQVVANYWPRT